MRNISEVVDCEEDDWSLVDCEEDNWTVPSESDAYQFLKDAANNALYTQNKQKAKENHILFRTKIQRKMAALKFLDQAAQNSTQLTKKENNDADALLLNNEPIEEEQNIIADANPQYNDPTSKTMLDSILQSFDPKYACDVLSFLPPSFNIVNYTPGNDPKNPSIDIELSFPRKQQTNRVTYRMFEGPYAGMTFVFPEKLTLHISLSKKTNGMKIRFHESSPIFLTIDATEESVVNAEVNKDLNALGTTMVKAVQTALSWVLWYHSKKKMVDHFIVKGLSFSLNKGFFELSLKTLEENQIKEELKNKWQGGVSIVSTLISTISTFVTINPDNLPSIPLSKKDFLYSGSMWNNR